MKKLKDILQTKDIIKIFLLNFKQRNISKDLDSYNLTNWVDLVQKKKPELVIQKLTDIERLIILYEDGGIYLDQDHIFMNESNLDELIPFVSQDRIWKNISNSLMGFCKNDPHILELIKLIPSSEVDKWASIGPKLFSR